MKHRLALYLAGTLWFAPGTADPLSLAGSEWQPTRLHDEAVAGHVAAFLQFRDAGRLFVFAGCNELSGEYRVSGQRIRLRPLSSTRWLCEPDVMQSERALIRALEQVRSYRRVKSRLTLFDARGSALLEMRQTDWD